MTRQGVIDTIKNNVQNKKRRLFKITLWGTLNEMAAKGKISNKDSFTSTVDRFDINKKGRTPSFKRRKINFTDFIDWY